ncbi:adenylate/guanylate cyclase domain-containing protein [Spirulina sp. CS-785/01]|uniref:adenylate/guanylate cyclase domain-containing protein n=1 Tax=Spirulina sp. CS-785/01 TaxID=3021716 RepID=UPI0023311CA4|nr:adenylate/guanylate cyclase domain-containing protein [Spirulina sp. CS-785/01]MDB9315832.1 adenylate/guanylate cyclase domain-containing protein [Spirulina sp. CS-785/01]
MSSFNEQIFIPPHVQYIVLDADLIVRDFSLGVLQFIEAEDSFAVNQDIRESFPEIIGCEAIFEGVLAGHQPGFDLKGISRTTPTHPDQYIDLYFQKYSGPQGENYLVLFVEDVTEKMQLEQTLVQSTNETNLLLTALTASRNYINRIVSSIADALIVTDTQHTITTVNHATEKLLGYCQDELVHESFFEFILEGEQQLLELPQILQQQGELSRNLELICQTKAGTKIIVAFSCSGIQTETHGDGNPHSLTPEIVYIGRDITERRRTQQRLATQYAIANILSESTGLETATHNILAAIGENLEWDIGELWLPLQAGISKPIPLLSPNALYSEEVASLPTSSPYLQRVDFWSNNAPIFQRFVDQTNRVLLQAGVGLAGRVWVRGIPQWISDLSRDVDFGEESGASKVGLQSAFAFPIQSGNEMLGVMSFFGREQLPPDQNLLQMMAATGNQLGQFIKRKEAEKALWEQQEKTESLLLNILPQPIAERLKEDTQTIADNFDEVTVLFADLVGFTEIASDLPPIAIVEQLNVIFSQFDQLTERHNLEKIKTIGDAYMVVGGLPTPRTDHASAIAEMALDMRDTIKQINQETGQQFQIRMGINTGSVVAGVIGTKKFIYDLWGDTVNTASRMESHGISGCIQVTAATYEHLKSQYRLEKRGVISIKGKGEMTTYLLVGR